MTDAEFVAHLTTHVLPKADAAYQQRLGVVFVGTYTTQLAPCRNGNVTYP